MDTSVAFRLEKLVLTRPQSQSLLSTLSGRGVLISLLIDLEKGPKVPPERPVCSPPALSLARLSTHTALWRVEGASGPCLLTAPPPLFWEEHLLVLLLIYTRSYPQKEQKVNNKNNRR